MSQRGKAQANFWLTKQCKKGRFREKTLLRIIFRFFSREAQIKIT